MKLSDKIRYLREVEGNLRGLNRAMTQQELVRAIQQENGNGRKASKGTISQSYLSQIESGARPHLNQYDAASAGEVLQGASRISG